MTKNDQITFNMAIDQLVEAVHCGQLTKVHNNINTRVPAR